MGVIVGLADASGDTVATVSYSAYGEILQESDLTPTSVLSKSSLRYKGYVYDSEIGMYFLGQRLYDPRLCRFLAPDPVRYLDPTTPNGLNLFCYCGCDPIMCSDPTGHAPEWVYWLVGGIVLAGTIALTVATGGSTAPVLIGAAIGTISGLLFGGIEFTSKAPTGNWDNAARGFCWGAVAGALGGAVGMFGSSFASASGIKGMSGVVFQLINSGITAAGLGALRATIEDEQWSLTEAGITFAFGAIGSLFSKNRISSIAIAFGLSMAEGITKETLDYYSLVDFPWRWIYT